MNPSDRPTRSPASSNNVKNRTAPGAPYSPSSVSVPQRVA